MRYKAILLATAAFVAAKSSAAVRMEHNAFLRRPVFSPRELVQELNADAKVGARYEKHFKMSRDTIRRFFRTLTLVPLSATRKYLVFNVDRKLVVRKRLLTLHKGTLVFADKKGRPVLKRSCGNPMVAYIPAIGVVSSTFAPTSAPEQAETSTEPSPPTMAATGAPLGDEPAAAPAPSPEVAIPVATVAAVAPAVAAAGAGISATTVVGALATAGGLVSVAGSSSNTKAPVKPGPKPVPEPLPVTALGAGLLLRRRFRRRRSEPTDAPLCPGCRSTQNRSS